jgi:tetratricopeptide (TPR) repeat protein
LIAHHTMLDSRTLRTACGLATGGAMTRVMAGAMLSALLVAPALAQSTAASNAPATSVPIASTEKSLGELQRLVNEGKFGRAYELAVSMYDSQGDAHFDFLYGVAAVNVGRTAEAVLALQRHLALVPGNDRARLDLARAYFEMGDYVRARQEFEFVLRYNPPADVRANINRYLDSMQTRETLDSRSNARLYVETGYGQDTNPGMLPDGGTAAGGFTTLQPPGTDFLWLAAGSRWVRQVTAPFAVFAGFDGDNKLNEATPQFNTSNISVYAGFSNIAGPMLYRLSVSDALTQLTNSRYMGRLSTTGEVQYAVGDGLTLSGRLQIAEQTYNAENNFRDATVSTLGFGIEQALQMAWRPVVGLSISEAQEENLTKRRDLSRTMDTWRVSVGLSPSDKTGLVLAYSQQQSSYLGVDALYNTYRFDTLSTLDINYSYLLLRDWTLKVDVQQMDNKTNQPLSGFKRTWGAVKLRYSF